MEALTVFSLQVATPMAVGLLVSTYLRGTTYRLLADVCGTSERADFWVRISSVAMVGGPLALVLAFGAAPTNCQDGVASCFADTLKQSLSLSLIGVLLGVLAVAQAIWRQVPRNTIGTER